MIKKINLAERFYLLLKVPSGTHIKDRRVNYQQVNSTKLEFKERVPFHVDGELHFANSFEVKVVPKSLRIIYNPDGKHFFRR
jgi:diacylglycerol kinase family enzyme